MEKWRRYVIVLLVGLFIGVGYMFYSKEPETPMVRTVRRDTRAGGRTECPDRNRRLCDRGGRGARYVYDAARGPCRGRTVSRRLDGRGRSRTIEFGPIARRWDESERPEKGETVVMPAAEEANGGRTGSTSTVRRKTN